MALPSGAATRIAPTADPAVVAGIIAGLSDEQKNAVLASEPYIRIVAAAGAGKTETITRRIVYLLAHGAPPQSIVAFTFTEKAAAQMKERIYRRVEDILGASAAAGLGRMFVGTIHAYCFRLLQDHYGLGNVDVLDQNQEVAFISRYVHPLGIAGPGQMQRMGRLLRTAAVYCDELLELSDVEACDPEVAARLGKYSAYLSRHRLITFGQLVRKAVEEVGRDPQGIGDLEHLVVDEFQDINPAQERLIHLIAGRATCCVVGDPRQCIYQWRGSDPGCFERFKELLPGVRDYPISANRRSVPEVVETANRVARHFESSDLRRPMTPVRTERGTAISTAFETRSEEAEWVARSIREAVDAGRCSCSQIAILLRSVGTSGPEFLDALEREGIHALVGGKVGLFRRKEAQAVGMLLCWMAGHFWRRQMHGGGSLEGADLLSEALSLWPGQADPAAVEAVAARARAEEYRNLNVLFHDLLCALGFRRFDPDRPADAAIIANLGRFNQMLLDYEAALRRGGNRRISLQSLAWYITGYAQGAYEEPQPDDLSDVDQVRLFTVHQAKGLEWPVVFVPCLTARRFPSRNTGSVPANDIPRRLYDVQRYAGGLEDERRLFYVAVTRARDALCLSHFRRISRSVSPSPFVAEAGLRPSVPARFPPRVHSSRAPDEEVVTIAASDVLSYRRCPYGYRLRSCWGYQAPLAPEIGYGRSVHHILRVLGEAAREGRTPAAEVDETVDREFHLPFAGRAQRDEIAAKAKSALRRYVKRHQDELARVQEVESRLEFALERRVTVSGRVDALIGPSESLELRDYKTGADPRLIEDAQLQVQLYAAGLRHLGVDVRTATVADVTADRTVEVPVGEGALAAATEVARRCVQGIVGRRFEARPGEECGGCDFRGICRYR